MDPQRFPERIETERLLLRAYTKADAAAMLELARENRERLRREFKEQARLQTVVEAEQFIAAKLDLWKATKAFCYGMWNSEARQVGQVQLKNIDWDIPSAEFGYFIGAAWQQTGYATESLRVMSRVAFAEFGFERLFVRILLSNDPSLRLVQKLGFQEEGILRKGFRCGFGELHDVRYLSLLRE